MPKSKRNRLVSLTTTRKKGTDLKRKVVEEVREWMDNYARVFVFSVSSMTTSKLREVRIEWRQSRFFFGKNKVVAAALGRTPEDECKENAHKISEHLHGQKGLLFTNATKDEVLKYFKSYACPDYARAGDIASREVILEEGPLEQFAFSMESYLRQLGLQTSLKKGVIHLVKPFTVCEEGETLTAEKAKLLKLLGIRMAKFYLNIELMWSNDGTVEDLRTKTSGKNSNESEEMDDDNCDDASDDVESDEN